MLSPRATLEQLGGGRQHLHSVYNCVEPQFLLALDMDVELPPDRNPHLVRPWARGVCECEHVPVENEASCVSFNLISTPKTQSHPFLIGSCMALELRA